MTRFTYTYKHSLDQFADKISESKLNKKLSAEALKMKELAKQNMDSIGAEKVQELMQTDYNI